MPRVVAAGAAMFAVAISCTEYDSDDTASRDAGEGAEAGDAGMSADAADAYAEASSLSCPEGLVLLGQFATLTGKVNVHTPTATDVTETRPGLNGWFPDPDCTTGADESSLAYCQRLWSNATVIQGPFATNVDQKPFLSAGCGAVPPATGRTAYVCCGKN